MSEEMKLPVLTVKDGSVVTNSRDVASFFEKRHDHLLNDIDALLPEIREQAMFVATATESRTGFGSRTYRSYDMNRDGFTLIAMSFTGKKALQFKLAYISHFNAMEEELRRRDEEEESDASIEARHPDEFSLRLVAEARRTFGAKAAQQMWGQQGLPVVPAMLLPDIQPQLSLTFGATVSLPRAA